MKRFIIGFIILLFVVIAGAIGVALLTPKDVYKQKIEEAATSALDRELKLNGDVGLSIFPRIAAEIEGVTLANPEGFSDPYMLQAGALKASVKWGPLFTGRVEVQEIAFIDADVKLEVLEDGRANWEFATGEAEPAEEAEAGSIDAGIDRARLTNASLSYVDAVAGTSYALTDLNAQASIASLADELRADGSGVFDGDAFSFDLVLDSPQAILDGKEASAKLDFGMDIIEASFDGRATLGEATLIDGAFTASTENIQALLDYAKIDPADLPVSIDPLSTFKTAGTASGSLENLALTFGNLDITGDGLTIGYVGGATYSDAPAANGRVTVNLDNAGATIDAFGLDIAQAGIVRGAKLTLSTDIAGPADAIQTSNVDLTIDGPLLKAAYQGAANVAETPSVDGNFSMNSSDLFALVEAANLGLEPGQADPLKGTSLNLTTKVKGPTDALAASGIDMKLNGPLLTVAYSGAVTVADAISVNGNIDLSSSDVYALLQTANLGLEPSQTDPLKGAALNLKSNLNGATDAISASGIALNLTGPLLNAAYQGDVSLANGGTINGTLTANSDQLRALLSAADVELTPGTTMQTFRVSGAASGRFDRLSVNNLDLALDDITGKGNLLLRTDTARPTLTGDLTTGALDLTPFMGEAAEDTPEGWSKEPLALESLKTADIDISLASPSIKIDNVTLRDANLKAKLTNGVLDTNINQFSVFGGLWKGGIDLNTSGATPSLAINMTGDSILVQEIVKTFAGTDMMTGGGAFKVNLTARGNSLHAIMNSLNGELSANLADGAIKGMNIGQLIRTATDLRSSLSSGGNLLSGLAVSPSAQSDFSAFNTVLKINNGVADIELMEILSSTFGANGIGNISLGGQTLDMALRIAADTNARGELRDVQLNNVGIPLRITGSWTSPRIAPDKSVLTQLLAGSALDRFGNLIQGRTGGNNDIANTVTGVLGNVLERRAGGANIPPPVNTTSTVVNPTRDPKKEDAKKEEPKSLEDAAKDAAKDAAEEALGNIFGRRKK